MSISLISPQRVVLATGLLSFLILCLSHSGHRANADDLSRPNFLFIAIDDLNDFTGYAVEEPGNFLQVIYPDAKVRADVTRRLTPNLDKLARNSAPFMRAYCPSALCGPSRTSLMTGVPPFRSGYYGHKTHFRTYDSLKEAVTLPQRLKQSGYFTTGLGKLFHKPTGTVNGPLKNDWSDARSSWSTWINHATGCNGGIPSKYSPPNGGNMVFGPSRLKTGQSGDWMAADFVARLLESGSAQIKAGGKRGKDGPDSVKLPGDQPFFLGCGLFRPHLPFYAPQEFLDRFPVDEMTGLNRESLDAIISDLNDLPSGAERFSDFTGGKLKVVMEHARSVGGVDAEPDAWREMVQAYLGCVAFADACLGRIIDGYDASPQRDNTVIFLWSDHGYHLGSKYHVAKQALWEEANRVQFIVHDPRHSGGRDGKPRRQIVSLNDLYPTICEMAGTEVGPQVEVGRSIVSLIENSNAEPVHDHLLMTYMKGNHSIRTATYKLNRYNDGSLELYDMVKDPFQYENLAGKAFAASVQSELAAQLTAIVGTVDAEPPDVSDANDTSAGDDKKIKARKAKNRARRKAQRRLSRVDASQTTAVDTSPAAKNRPNILLIITDDQNDYASAASGVGVQTPSLDRLGRESIQFPRAYCASPVCGPSRAALFSGLYPHHTGAYLNGSDPWLKSTQLQDAETLPELFKRSGYQTWGMGKLFHAKLPADRKEMQWGNNAQANGGFAPFGDETHQFAGKFFSVQEWDGPDTDFPDVKSVNAAISFLAKDAGDQPFFMVCGLWRPHNPWTAPRRFFDLYDPADVAFPPPGYREDDLSDVPTGGQKLSAIYKNRWDGFGDKNPDAWRRIMHGYLACTSFADWNVGRVLEALDRSSRADNTIVIVTSDNGFHIGEKHHYGKSTLWEKSANVPMLVRLPDRHHAGSTCDAAIGLIDLYPTLLSTCGLESPPQRLDGADLSPLLADPTTHWDRPAITTYGEGRFSMRSGPWRYIRYPDGQEELYDHRQDPHEFENLSPDAAFETQMQTFRSHVPESWCPSLGGRNG